MNKDLIFGCAVEFTLPDICPQFRIYIKTVHGFEKTLKQILKQNFNWDFDSIKNEGFIYAGIRTVGTFKKIIV